MNRALQTIGAVILCLTTSFAGPSAAIATAIGEAFLNGSVLTRSSAVFEGDRLSTGPSAAFILHLPGSSIHIGPNSAARFQGTTLELLSGSTEVQGRESIVSGAYTLSPTIDSRFTVQREPTKTALHLLQGSLKVTHAHQVTTLAQPGDYTLQDDAPAPAVKHHTITRALPIAAGAAAGASVIIAHWLTGKNAASSASCVSAKSPTSCK